MLDHGFDHQDDDAPSEPNTCMRYAGRVALLTVVAILILTLVPAFSAPRAKGAEKWVLPVSCTSVRILSKVLSQARIDAYDRRATPTQRRQAQECLAGKW